MRDFKYGKDITIPFEVIGAAYKVAQEEAKRNPEYWDTNESRRFRELLPNNFSRFDEDKLRRAAVSFRKKQEGDGGWKDYKDKNNIKGKVGGNGIKKLQPLLLKDHEARLLEPDWSLLRKACFDRDKVCRDCGEKLVDAHHLPQGYSAMRTPEEIHYLTGLCRGCHAMVTVRMRHRKQMDDFVQKMLSHDSDPTLQGFYESLKERLCQSNSR